MADEKERKSLEERQQMSEAGGLRHSFAHVMATAICRIWPDAQLAAGPPVENGFYYDMELSHRITPEDFLRIEEKMKREVKDNAGGWVRQPRSVRPSCGHPFTCAVLRQPEVWWRSTAMPVLSLAIRRRQGARRLVMLHTR
jgi:hypothetical protein